MGHSGGISIDEPMFGGFLSETVTVPNGPVTSLELLEPIYDQNEFLITSGNSSSMKATFGNEAIQLSSSGTSEEFDSMNISLIDYLSKLQPVMLQQLYTSSAACLAVFRELPALAQNFVLRLIFIEQPIPHAVVSSWVKSTTDYQQAEEALSKLHVWKSQQLNSLPGWLLNSSFREGLKSAWLGGGKSRSIFSTLGVDKHKPDLESLDNYAITKRWDSILNFMAGVKLKDYNDNIGETTKKVIFQAGLIESDNQDTLITAAGFQFLLMDISSQIWFFLRKYLELVGEFNLNFIECLSFMFELNFLTLGKSYSTEGMSDSIQTFLQHLREMGLVYQRKRKDGRFYPTRLMIQLFESVRQNFQTSSTSLTATPTPSIKRQGFIVIETNYRIYAYTESPLQIALLTLFIELNYRFPKFIAGFITRDSVRMAFKNGITAKQITHYLTMHAHPNMHLANRTTIIPTLFGVICKHTNSVTDDEDDNW
ncbi:General transcription factor IIH subunit 4 [Blomia tropicalis]|nr:General transcription factor IIH subunit 4 [Blomia tropicalis]